MLSRFSKITIFSFFVLLSLSHSSCKKNNDSLQQEIADLDARVSGIEGQITEINTSLTTLQQQGKLNSDEISSLKALTNTLTTVTTDIKSSNTVNSTDIASLKASIQLAITTVQYDDLKNTITQLSALVNKNYTEQQFTAKSTTDLQTAISKIAADLETLMTGQSVQVLSGRIEKGGFTKGSLLNIFEMDSGLAQTGRSFVGTITDNYGSFNLKVQNLKGKVAKVVATGFYYNEVAGHNSSSQISLTGLVKIDSSSAINVNVLTALEEPRVEYLVNQGKSFNDSKTQAANEVLNVFGIQNSGIIKAEKVNLIGSSKQSNMLLSLSTMLVGFRSDSELLEILSDIGDDLKTDGRLDNSALGNDIMTHLYYLDTTTVINQVKNKYASLYPDSVLSKINLSYLNAFKQSSSYTKSYELITYPSTSSTVYNGKNILNAATTLLTSNIFEVSANLKSSSLKLRIEILGQAGALSELLGTNKNWTVSYPSSTKAVLETTTAGLNTITFTTGNVPSQKETLTINFFETGTSIPTKTQIVKYDAN
jgi:uncharacterized coiled-coil protein SlyX